MLRWSAELAGENPDYILVKIDGTGLEPNAVFREVTFEVAFYDAKRSQFARESFHLAEEIAKQFRPGVVNGTYVPHTHAGAQSVKGLTLHGTVGPLGGKADGFSAIVQQSTGSSRVSDPGNLAGARPAPRPGILYWYRGSDSRGTREVADGRIVGLGGWEQFKSVFSAGNEAIYAITNDGNLLWYRGTNGDGTREVAGARMVGQGGWQQFKFLFAGENETIYAVTNDGNLLCY
jgi:hypothetical protein